MSDNDSQPVYLVPNPNGLPPGADVSLFLLLWPIFFFAMSLFPGKVASDWARYYCRHHPEGVDAIEFEVRTLFCVAMITFVLSGIFAWRKVFHSNSD